MVGGTARSGLFGVIVVLPLLISRIPKASRNSKKESVQYCTLFVTDCGDGTAIIALIRPRIIVMHQPSSLKSLWV
jgi:hypothetical protein